MVKLPGSEKSGKQGKPLGKATGKSAQKNSGASATKGKPFAKKAGKPDKKSALEKNGNEKKVPNVIAEWLYLADHEVDVEEIAASFTNKKECEIWTDAQIAEVILTEKASMDMERAEAVMEDEIGEAFLKEHGVTELYLVTIVPEEYELAKAAMSRIIAHCGGFFCADNDDFTPQIRL